MSTTFHPFRRALLPLLLLAAACAAPAGAPAPERVTFPGFDTWRYPGDALMERWRAESPYRWVGYYLPAPCHRGTSWVGKRETLERLGWGIAVLYVGQQAFEGQPSLEEAPVDTVICSRTLLTAEQGRTDARDAAAKAAREGFPPGSVVFLDIERVQTVSPALAEYYQSWILALLEDGRYRPGTYAHRENASELYLRAQAAHETAGADANHPFWVAGTGGFSLESPPRASGVPFADIWQGALDVERTWGGDRLQVDENVAATPDPSAPAGSR